MNLNTGKDWSEMGLWDLRNSIGQGSTIEEVADFLCRDAEEVRNKLTELGIAVTRQAAIAKADGPPPAATESRK